MTIVIDASVSLKWVIEEEGSDAAFALQNQRLTAPSLWLAEAGNALWRHVRLGEIVEDEAAQRLDLLRRAAVRTTELDLDAAAALRLAATLNHPIYDCFYLAAAIRQETFVATADARFASVVRGSKHASRVRVLGEDLSTTH